MADVADDADDVEALGNGGWAFPQLSDIRNGEEGMTLRDYFAAKALPVVFEDAEMDSEYDAIAAAAYSMADAMLRMRKVE